MVRILQLKDERSKLFDSLWSLRVTKHTCSETGGLELQGRGLFGRKQDFYKFFYTTTAQAASRTSGQSTKQSAISFKHDFIQESRRARRRGLCGTPLSARASLGAVSPLDRPLLSFLHR